MDLSPPPSMGPRRIAGADDVDRRGLRAACVTQRSSDHRRWGATGAGFAGIFKSVAPSTLCHLHLSDVDKSGDSPMAWRMLAWRSIPRTWSAIVACAGRGRESLAEEGYPMSKAIRAASLVGVALALLVLGGCENNEANVQGVGVTPPGAAATSEEGAKVPLPEKKKPPAGYGSQQGYGGRDPSRAGAPRR
jgi:hypothetical protein